MRKLSILPVILLCGHTVTVSADNRATHTPDGSESAPIKLASNPLGTHRAAAGLASDIGAPVQRKLARVPLAKVLDSVSSKTGHRFALEDRVPASVVIGELALDGLGEVELMHILDMNGLAAVRRDGLVSIIASVNIRQKAIPLVDGTEKDLLDGEWVSYVLRPNMENAGALVPLLRPLMSQSGHLAVLAESGAILLVERWENIRRLETIVDAMTSPTTRP